MDLPQATPGANPGQANPGANPGSGGEANTLTEQTVNELVNRAITARLKPFSEKLEKTLGDLTTGVTGKLEEFSKQFEALKPKEDPKPKPKDKDAPINLADLPEWQATQKQLADQQKKLDAAERKAAEAEAKRRDTMLRERAREALTAAGVDSKRARQAMALLVDSEKRIQFSEDGEDLVFVDGDETVPLIDGLKKWAKSEDAQIYLPPRGTAGSGDRGGGSAPRTQAGGQTTKEQVGNALVNLL